MYTNWDNRTEEIHKGMEMEKGKEGTDREDRE